MSKVEINNEVVLMRKIVRQARVRFVKKWIKKSNQLKAKKGTEAQLEKNKRGSERLISQVLAVKKVKDDEISKFAITNTRTLKEILEDQKLSPRERAIGQISFFEKLQNQVKEFKKKYPDYEEHLKTGDNNKPKNKTKKEKRDTKKSQKKKADKDEDGNSSSSEDLTKKYNIKPGSILRLKPSEDTDEDSNEDESEIRHSVDKDESPQKKLSPKKRKRDKQGVQENIADKKKKRKENSQSIEVETSMNEKSDESNVQEMQKEEDPFFVSNDSSTYMRVKAPKSYELDNKADFQGNKYSERDNKMFEKSDSNKFRNDKFNKKSFHSYADKSNSGKFKKQHFKDDKNKFSNNKFNKFSNDKTSEQFGNKDNQFYKNKFASQQNKKNDFKSKVQNTSSFKKFEAPNDKFKQSPPKQQQSLHPSWEAKKKQQESLKLGFQGKKIVFDD